MYLLINGKEVTKAQIVRAVREGRAALIDSNGVAALAIHTEPLKFDELYYVSGRKAAIEIQRPSNINEALEAAYF